MTQCLLIITQTNNVHRLEFLLLLVSSYYQWSSVVLSQGAGTIDRTLSDRSMLYLTGHRCAANQVDIASPGWSAACLPFHCLLMHPFWCTHLSSIAGVYQPDTLFIRFIRPHRTGATILPTNILFHWPRLSRTKAAPDKSHLLSHRTTTGRFFAPR